MSRYGYLGSISGGPLDFEITRVDCSAIMNNVKGFFFCYKAQVPVYLREIYDPANTAKPWNIMSRPKDPGRFSLPYNSIKKIDLNATKVAEI